MATKTVDVREAQHRLTELLAQVAAGDEVLLTDGPWPRARLVPVPRPAQSRVPGLQRGSVAMTADFDAPLPDDFWMGSK